MSKPSKNRFDIQTCCECGYEFITADNRPPKKCPKCKINNPATRSRNYDMTLKHKCYRKMNKGKEHV